MTARGTVLHFIDTTGPGGAETVFLQVAAGLERRGWRGRSVIVGPGWVLDTARSMQLAIDITPTHGRFDLSYVRALRGLIRRHDVDLIHAHLFSPAVYASAIGAWTRTPVVATFHGASDAVAGGFATRLRYRLLDRRATIVCVSESLRDQLAALNLVRNSRIHVIHNGTDPAAHLKADGSAVRNELGLTNDAILIGALGNVRPAKDFPNFLRAAARLAPDRRFAFAIAGDCAEPLSSQLRALCAQLGIADRVSFLGFRSDVPEVLAAFDVLAISSTTEGFSLAAIQAMAAGTPVVATRSGGPEQILTDGVDGLLVPIQDPDSLATAIRQIIDKPNLRAQLTAAARVTVDRRFSLDTMLNAYERLYTQVLQSRRVPQQASLEMGRAANAGSANLASFEAKALDE